MENSCLHLSDLVARLCTVAGVDAQTSEEFTQAFVQTVSENLATSGKVTVKSFGTFKFDRITGLVEFTPSKELNGLVNSSFSIFEPVELDDDYPVENETENTKDTTALSETDSEDTTSKTATGTPAEAAVTSPTATEDTFTTISVAPEDPLPIVDEDYTQPNRRNSWIYWGGLLIGVCIGFIMGFLLRPAIISNKISESKTEINEPIKPEPVPVDSVSDAPDSIQQLQLQDELKNNQKIVLDTIQERRFLATMSRRHYGGRPEFWIYIYEENRDKIKDPGKVSVGTVLIIPPREKYGIDPSSPESRAKARQRALELTGK